MGAGQFNSIDYAAAVNALKSTGANFARSAAAASTGNFSNLAEILNPRKLKNGVRESCFAPGFDDATAIIVSIDGTGSMEQIPYHIQQELPKLLELLTEKGVSDHPNILFMCHDDELACVPDAVFQMSQYEIESVKLIAALNEMIIPGPKVAATRARLTISLSTRRRITPAWKPSSATARRVFFFMICDEEPFYFAGDPTMEGTSPAIAKEVFGDTIEATVPMLESIKKVCERNHVFILRPGHTTHGKNKAISRLWQDLLRKAGENPEHVLEVEETEAMIPTIALSIGRLADVDQDDLVDVLKAKGAAGIDSAINATRALVPAGGKQLAVAGKASGALVTAKGAAGRKRR